ncbi:methyltransferase domain-containing protein [Pseudomonas chlororaphis]|uniref:methyltransferase domain-containing protein n=1 Tax=Pseudomonas chlororaphis TaxID=587753 RepID=UPI00209AE726|nr:methyltransferase domain-containing protein [Pseudomonas chlororaphis]MCO7570123.1 methyltransferase domain-containing protein [Pseudomonas chlororaphis]MCO7587270.1 methyltransferase domain-containing protein [Pseudomonas chlororaphis]MCO7610376.1 methyltransferase domain-containing protein [Pseudomonas chlororaphis]
MAIDQAAGDLAGDLARLILALTTQQDEETHAPRMAIETPFSTMSQSDWAQAVDCWNRAGRPLIAQLEVRGCPACGAEHEQRPIFESYDGYGYEECGQCGCWYVPLKVDARLFEQFFTACPQAAEVLQRSFQKRLSAENLQADLARFNDYFSRLSLLFSGRQGLRYLDMGCGLGNSLIAAREHGFDGVGVESSRECLTICQESGLRVLHDEQKPAGVFDLISFWESLEHMVDPAQMLRSCQQLLAENGVLAFTIPNLDSPLLRAQRGDCSVVHGGYDTPGHINLFGPGQVRHLLERCGFELLHMDGQYGMSLPELAAYMLGRHRGAADLLIGRGESQQLPAATRTLLNAIGPAISLLERFSLTTPILFVVACRQGDAAALAPQKSTMAQQRRAELLAQAEPMAQAGTAARMIELNQHVLRVEEQASSAVEALKRETIEAQEQSLRDAQQQQALHQEQQHELQQELLQRSEQLSRMAELISQEMAHATERERELVELRQGLAHQEQELSRMAELISQEMAHATERERELVELRQGLAHQEQELSRRDVALAGLAEQLQLFKRSRTYRLIQLLGRLTGRQ